LTPHPAAGAGPVAGLQVTLRIDQATRCLVLDYRIEADPGQLLLPKPASPGRHDGLWRHTCLEAFLRTAGGAGYVEFNFSPSGQWAAYHFDGRREGMQTLALRRDPAPRSGREPGAAWLSVALDLDDLPAGPLEIGLSAVVEAAGGHFGYWALRHGDGPPDFHDPESFTLHLCTGVSDSKA